MRWIAINKLLLLEVYERLKCIKYAGIRYTFIFLTDLGYVFFKIIIGYLVISVSKETLNFLAVITEDKTKWTLIVKKNLYIL